MGQGKGQEAHWEPVLLAEQDLDIKSLARTQHPGQIEDLGAVGRKQNHPVAQPRQEESAAGGDSLEGADGEVSQIAQDQVACTEQGDQIRGAGLVIAGEGRESETQETLAQQIVETLDAKAGLPLATLIGRAGKERRQARRQ